MSRDLFSRFIPLRGFPQLQSLVTDNFAYRNEYTRLGLFSIGVGLALFKTLSLTKTILTPLFYFNRDLGARYGKGSWAVITGASDGIGKGYAFELARRGFNIVLVGRNREKLDNVTKELKSATPEVQTRIIVADFNNAYKEGFAEEIHSQTTGLDVSILINNAGIYSVGEILHELPSETIVNMVMTNCLAHALITKVFLQQLALRKSRSAIINTSSLAAALPVAYMTLYSASKAFHDFLSRGISYEHPNLDILSVKPGPVSTRLNNYQKPGQECVSVEEYVRTTLNKLGRVTHTCGHWRHSMLGFFLTNYPESLKGDMFKKEYRNKKE